MIDTEELSLCQLVHFVPALPLQWVETVYRMAATYSNELGFAISHFSFWPGDDDVKRMGVYKNIKRNRGRLRDAAVDETLNGVWFYSLDEIDNYTEAPFKLLLVTKDMLSFRAIGMGQGEETVYGTLLWQCPLRTLEADAVVDRLAGRFLRDAQMLFKPAYGLVSTIQRRKYPDAYFMNSPSSPHLTPMDTREIELWRKEGHRFQSVLRNVYWGNLISTGHWRGDASKKGYLVSGLKQLCHGMISEIDDETLFFRCPIDILALEDEEDAFRRWRHEVRILMAECRIEIIAPEV